MSTHSVTLETSDGLRLRASLRRSGASSGRVLIIAPGYTQFAETPVMRRVAERLGVLADTLSLDFRGTGGSEGRYAFGLDEVADIDAAVTWAQSHYDDQIVVGLSMGAAATVCFAVDAPVSVRGLMLVSCPTHLADVLRTGGLLRQAWGILRGEDSWRTRWWAGGTPWMRYGSPIRVVSGRARLGADALRAASSVRTPAVFVVGDADPLVLPRLSRSVFEAYAGPKTYVVCHGGRHAEYLVLSHPSQFVESAQRLLTMVEDETGGDGVRR